MKYATRYSNTSKITDKVDEIIIIFNKSKINTLFEDFIPTHQEQRVIINISSGSYEEDFEAIKQICTIHKEHPELKFDLLVNFFEKEFIDYIKSANLNFFLDMFIDNWDTLIGIMNLGVSDVYIVEQLAFELDKVSKIAHEKNIKVRVFPNVAQAHWIDTPSIYRFFIRPEDIEAYEPYIDICELFGDLKKVDTYYKIYAEDRKWFGNLNELIISLDSNLDSRFIIPRFAEKRIRCGKACFKGDNCKICERILELSKTLKDAKLMVTIDKDKNNSSTLDKN